MPTEAFMDISGSSHLNTSLSVGDLLYCTCMNQNDGFWVNTSSPILFGEVTDITSPTIGFQVTGYGGVTPDNISCAGTKFISFAKNKAVNESSLKGYYNLVTFLNDDNNREAELFMVNSEVTPSSK